MKYIIDHVQQAKENALSQFKDSPKFQAFLALAVGQIQDAENALHDLFWRRLFESAVGSVLDDYGGLLDLARNGLADFEYRRFLRAQIKALLSNGNKPTLLRIMELLTESKDIHFQSTYPAAYLINYQVNVPFSRQIKDAIKSVMINATSSGVGIQVTESEQDYFGFLDDPNALGFGDGIFSEVI